MKCNIRTIGRGVKEVQCYKTGYKNVVIAKLDEDDEHCYSITHWQTGIALSFDRYETKQEAINDIESVINEVRKELKENKTTIKQFCKRKELEQINF